MRGRSAWSDDAISVADVDTPPVVFATEHGRHSEFHEHEFVGASALRLCMFDGRDATEIVTCPPSDLVAQLRPDRW